VIFAVGEQGEVCPGLEQLEDRLVHVPADPNALAPEIADVDAQAARIQVPAPQPLGGMFTI
jgi:hypothetical protein